MTIETQKNFENLDFNLNSIWEFSNNILNLENILIQENKEQTEKCCKNLNNIFSEELAKKWFDFNLALNTKIPKFIW